MQRQSVQIQRQMHEDTTRWRGIYYQPVARDTRADAPHMSPLNVLSVAHRELVRPPPTRLRRSQRPRQRRGGQHYYDAGAASNSTPAATTVNREIAHRVSHDYAVSAQSAAPRRADDAEQLSIARVNASREAGTGTEIPAMQAVPKQSNQRCKLASSVSPQERVGADQLSNLVSLPIKEGTSRACQSYGH